jgi:hypothetical protein
MNTYEISYQRTLTVESEEAMSLTDLVEHAKEELSADGLWSARIDMGGGVIFWRALS